MAAYLVKSKVPSRIHPTVHYQASREREEEYLKNQDWNHDHVFDSDLYQNYSPIFLHLSDSDSHLAHVKLDHRSLIKSANLT